MGTSWLLENFKRYLLIIVISLICAGVLLGVGVKTVSGLSSNRLSLSSYKLTTFDYVVTSPSDEQVQTFKNTDGINAVFPCYHTVTTLRAGQSGQVDLLLSESLESYEAGLFNEQTLIKGQADGVGIMLDKKASEKLGADVGDNVTFFIAGYSYSYDVCAIYLSSTYRDMASGVALAVMTEQMQSRLNRSYDLAYIDAEDLGKCEEMLQGYKPYGRLQSQEDYIAEYKAGSTKPSYYTDEEWTESIIVAYNQYVEKFEQGTYPTSVQPKALFMADAEEMIESSDYRLNALSVITAIAVPVVFAVCGAIVLLINKRNDGIRISQGVDKSHILTGYLLAFALCAVAVSALNLAVLLSVAGSSGYFSECISAVLLFSMPVLAGFVPLSVGAVIYTRTLGAVAVKPAVERVEESEEAVETSEENEETVKTPEENEKTVEAPEENEEAVKTSEENEGVADNSEEDGQPVADTQDNGEEENPADGGE